MIAVYVTKHGHKTDRGAEDDMAYRLMMAWRYRYECTVYHDSIDPDNKVAAVWKMDGRWQWFSDPSYIDIELVRGK